MSAQQSEEEHKDIDMVPREKHENKINVFDSLRMHPEFGFESGEWKSKNMTIKRGEEDGTTKIESHERSRQRFQRTWKGLAPVFRLSAKRGIAQRYGHRSPHASPI